MNIFHYHLIHYHYLRIEQTKGLLLADGFACGAAGLGRTFAKTPFNLPSNSSTVVVMPVTMSNGAPVLPMKNSDGNGTSLSTQLKR